MKTYRRTIVAMIFFVAAFLVVACQKENPSIEKKDVVTRVESKPSEGAQGAGDEVPPVLDPPKQEGAPSLEEVLTSSGEKSGAAFYFSRIQEAVEEGNPGFGRQLLSRLKKEHPQSGLIQEAEALVGKNG